MPGRRLSNEERAEIITAYASTESIPKTAAMTNHSTQTIQRIVSDSNNQQALADAKKQIAQDAMDKFLTERQGQAQEIIGRLMSALVDESKIERANLQQVAMTLGIVIDKFTPQNAQCGPVAIQINFNAGGQGDDFA